MRFCLSGLYHTGYDGDGNRVEKTLNGVVTRYLIDTQNPTGYSQVLEEQDSLGTVKKRYTYGIDLISQSEYNGSGWETNYYGYG